MKKNIFFKIVATVVICLLTLNCYAQGKAFYGNKHASATVTITKCYADEALDLNVQDGDSKPLADLQKQSFHEGLLGWNFDEIWKIREGEFPVFQWQFYNADVIEAAIEAIESASYSVSMDVANSEAHVTVWLVGQINDLLTKSQLKSSSIASSTSITISESDIDVSVTPAEETTDGSFNFTVSLSKGEDDGTAFGTAYGIGTILKTTTGMNAAKAGQFYSVTGSNNSIEFTGFEPLFVSVYDITGKALFAAQVNGLVSIPVAQGIYILKLKGAGKETVQKIIVK